MRLVSSFFVSGLLLGLAVHPLAASPDPTALAAPVGHWHVRHFGVREGLPHGTVFALTASRSGHLLIGAGSQVVRFDGRSFEPVWGSESPRAEATVNALLEDDDGGLWIGRDRGEALLRVGPGTAVRRFTRADGLPHTSVRALCRDRTGTLWVGTEAGVARLQAGRFVALAATRGAEVRTLICARDGDVWLVLKDGQLQRLRDGRIISGPPLAALSARGVRRVYQAPDGRLWLGMLHDGMATLSPDGRGDGAADGGLSGTRVKALLQARDGQLWIGTWGEGLMRLRAGQLEKLDPRIGLPSAAITELLEDARGTLWVGSAAGLTALVQRPFVTLSQAHGLSGAMVRAVAETSDGSVWVGTANAGLNRIRPAIGAAPPAVEHLRTPALPSDTILALAAGPRGTLYVASKSGVVRWDGAALKPVPSRGPAPWREPWAVQVDDEGALWVAARPAGLWRVRGEVVTAFGPSQGYWPHWKTRIAEDGRGGLWVSAGAQLYRFDRDRGVFALACSLPDRTLIESLAVAHDGVVWMGTARGLSAWHRGGLEHYPAADWGLPIPVAQLVQDQTRALWLASRDGLLRLSRPPDPATTPGDLARTRLGVADGMLTADFSYDGGAAACMTRDGRLWFPSSDELVVVSPERVRRHAPPGPVSLTVTGIDGRPQAAAAALRVVSGAKVLFRATAIDLAAPETVLYRFRLEGHDRDWRPPQEHGTLELDLATTGDYRLRLAVRGRDGAWNWDAARLSFAVVPRWYQRGDVRAAAFIVVVFAMVVTLAHGRARRLRLHFAAVTRERSRIARELHDTVEQNLVALALHLKAAEARIDDGDQAALPFLDRARAIAAHIKEDVRHQVWDLRERDASVDVEHQDALPARLHRLLAEIETTSPIETKLQVSGTARALEARLETALLRIAQAAVSNAVRHAAATSIQLALDFTPHTLRLTVIDDGHGFDVTAALAAPASFGLRGMRERAEALGAELHFVSQVGGGTCVEVSIDDESASKETTPWPRI